MIPKVIHCCWFGGGRKTPLVEKCMASWRRFEPGWEIREWTEDEMRRTFVPPKFFDDAIKNGKWAFASDWARFAVVAGQGGVYLDMDVELVAPIDDIVDGGPFFALSSDSPGWINPGLGFAAERGDPVCAAIAKRYETMKFDPACHGSQTVLTVSNDVLKGFPERRLVPATVFDPKRGCAGRLVMSPETRAIHHYAASWFNWKQRLAYMWWPRVRNCAMRLVGGVDD